MPASMTRAEFAQSIKAKYPVYASIPDDELATKMLAAYPQYQAQIKDAAPTAAPAAPAASGSGLGTMKDAIQSMKDAEAARIQSGRDFITGVGKSILGTVEGGGQLVRSALHLPDSQHDPLTIPAPSAQPTNASQAAGKTAGNVGQYFLVGSKLAPLKAALATGTGILDALVGAGIEGASTAGVQSAQQGNTQGVGSSAATAAGLGVAAQGGAKALGVLGERVERALVKPTTADVKDGFQVSNIFKYKLGGSLTDTFDKTTAKLGELTDKAKQYLQWGKVLDRNVNLRQALVDTATELEGAEGAAKNFGQNAAIKGAIDKLVNDPLFQHLPQSGDMDLATAQKVKQAVGELGAWLHDPSGRVMTDPESRAMERVANTLYQKLKVDIEKQAIGPLRVVNQQMSEIIPIRQAIIRRIPVEQRANVLNLGDLLSLSTHTFPLAIANRVLKSGQAANAMVGASEIAPAIGAGVARGSGAALSQMNSQ